MDDTVRCLIRGTWIDVHYVGHDNMVLPPCYDAWFTFSPALRPPLHVKADMVAMRDLNISKEDLLDRLKTSGLIFSLEVLLGKEPSAADGEMFIPEEYLATDLQRREPERFHQRCRIDILCILYEHLNRHDQSPEGLDDARLLASPLKTRFIPAPIFPMRSATGATVAFWIPSGTEGYA